MNKQEIKDLLDDVQILMRQWEQETQGADANKTYETYGKIPNALDKLDEIIRYDRSEIDEKTFEQVCGLRNEIAEGLKGTKQFLSRLEPLQRMVVKFADEAKKVAKKIGYTLLADKCSDLLDFCYCRPSDFHHLPRNLLLDWTYRVIQLRADLLQIKNDMFLNLKDAQYDRYRENIEQLQAEYKAILDYLEQTENEDKGHKTTRTDRLYLFTHDCNAAEAKTPKELGKAIDCLGWIPRKSKTLGATIAVEEAKEVYLFARTKANEIRESIPDPPELPQVTEKDPFLGIQTIREWCTETEQKTTPVKELGERRWKPPKNCIGSKEIVNTYRVPRTTLQGWQECDPPKPKVIKDPQTQENYYTRKWFEKHHKNYRPRVRKT
jgi:hypothetical protein